MINRQLIRHTTFMYVFECVTVRSNNACLCIVLLTMTLFKFTNYKYIVITCL